MSLLPSSARPRAGLLLVVLLVASACSSPSTLTRHTLSEPPTIDGTIDEWAGRLSYVNGEPVSLSVAPTDSMVYVAVSVQDRDLLRTIALNGLMVWIDPTAQEQRTYGIHYPMGLRVQQREAQASPSRPDASQQDQRSVPELSLSELDVVRGTAHRRVPARHTSGLRAQATLSQGTMTYELAVPIQHASTAASASYGLRQPLDGALGVGLSTPEPEDDVQNRPTPTPGIPSVTGGERRGRSPRSGRTRQPQPSPPDGSERSTLDVWTVVVPANGE